jgi:hypothetical protein
MKKVAILQSNYIPWKGYFDLIAYVDEFILFDDMQYTRRDWRNRNQIKTPQGLQWLTVPVQVKGRFYQKIRETEIAGTEWATTHWRTIEQNYRKAPYFREITDWLEPLYLATPHTHLSALNRCFLEAVCSYLDIQTPITNSWDYPSEDGQTERLVRLCHEAGGTEYVSGPAAKNYIDETLFKAQKITLTWFDYSGYPEYPQLWGEFRHGVSILDMLFNCGLDSRRSMRYLNR